MVLHLLPRIDYPVLLAAARELGFSELPDELPMNLNETEHRELLELLYTVLFDVRLMFKSSNYRLRARVYVGACVNGCLYTYESASGADFSLQI